MRIDVFVVGTICTRDVIFVGSCPCGLFTCTRDVMFVGSWDDIWSKGFTACLYKCFCSFNVHSIEQRAIVERRRR